MCWAGGGCLGGRGRLRDGRVCIGGGGEGFGELDRSILSAYIS